MIFITSRFEISYTRLESFIPLGISCPTFDPKFGGVASFSHELMHSRVKAKANLRLQSRGQDTTTATVARVNKSIQLRTNTVY